MSGPAGFEPTTLSPNSPSTAFARAKRSRSACSTRSASRAAIAAMARLFSRVNLIPRAIADARQSHCGRVRNVGNAATQPIPDSGRTSSRLTERPVIQIAY